MQCPRCLGSGKCTDCGGQGWVTCLTCEGSGRRLTPRGAEVECRSCRGTGRAECSPNCLSCEGSGEITEVLQRRVREKYDVRWDRAGARNLLSLLAASACVLIWLIGRMRPEAGKWMAVNLSNWSGVWNQPWRWITSCFLHVNEMHLLLNILGLMRFGPLLESGYGPARFLLLSCLSGLSGSLLSSAANTALGHAVSSVGMSGVIFGYFGAMAGSHVRHGVFARSEISSLLTYLVIYSGVGVSMGTNVDHWAHAGGFLAGLICGYVMRRPSVS